MWQRADRDGAAPERHARPEYRLYAPPEGGRRPLVAVKPFVKLPVARDPIGSERPDVGPSCCSHRPAVGVEPRRRRGSRPDRAAAPGGIPAAGRGLGVALVGGDRAPRRRSPSSSSRPRRARQPRESPDDIALLYKLTPLMADRRGMRTTLVGPGPDWSAFVGLSARLAAGPARIGVGIDAHLIGQLVDVVRPPREMPGEDARPPRPPRAAGRRAGAPPGSARAPRRRAAPSRPARPARGCPGRPAPPACGPPRSRRSARRGGPRCGACRGARRPRPPAPSASPGQR